MANRCRPLATGGRFGRQPIRSAGKLAPEETRHLARIRDTISPVARTISRSGSATTRQGRVLDEEFFTNDCRAVRNRAIPMSDLRCKGRWWPCHVLRNQYAEVDHRFQPSVSGTSKAIRPGFCFRLTTPRVIEQAAEQPRSDVG